MEKVTKHILTSLQSSPVFNGTDNQTRRIIKRQNMEKTIIQHCQSRLITEHFRFIIFFKYNLFRFAVTVKVIRYSKPSSCYRTCGLIVATRTA